MEIQDEINIEIIEKSDSGSKRNGDVKYDVESDGAEQQIDAASAQNQDGVNQGSDVKGHGKGSDIQQNLDNDDYGEANNANREAGVADDDEAVNNYVREADNDIDGKVDDTGNVDDGAGNSEDAKIAESDEGLKDVGSSQGTEIGFTGKGYLDDINVEIIEKSQPDANKPQTDANIVDESVGDDHQEDDVNEQRETESVSENVGDGNVAEEEALPDSEDAQEIRTTEDEAIEKQESTQPEKDAEGEEETGLNNDENNEDVDVQPSIKEPEISEVDGDVEPSIKEPTVSDDVDVDPSTKEPEIDIAEEDHKEPAGNNDVDECDTGRIEDENMNVKLDEESISQQIDTKEEDSEISENGITTDKELNENETVEIPSEESPKVPNGTASQEKDEEKTSYVSKIHSDMEVRKEDNDGSSVDEQHTNNVQNSISKFGTPAKKVCVCFCCNDNCGNPRD